MLASWAVITSYLSTVIKPTFNMGYNPPKSSRYTSRSTCRNLHNGTVIKQSKFCYQNRTNTLIEITCFHYFRCKNTFIFVYMHFTNKYFCRRESKPYFKFFQHFSLVKLPIHFSDSSDGIFFLLKSKENIQNCK